jgi:hypothetical protein
MSISEKIEEMQSHQSDALKELDVAQQKVGELQALIQRQTGALRVLMDLRDEQGAAEEETEEAEVVSA